MKNFKLFNILAISVAFTACSNEPKESDELLSNYKKQQLEKAEKVEQEMSNRLDKLNKQLDGLEEQKKDEPK